MVIKLYIFLQVLFLYEIIFLSGIDLTLSLTEEKGYKMKKLVLTSLLTVFAVSAANAETNYFVGGAAAIATDNDHATVLAVAPEFGWKMDSNWDLGVAARFAYDHKDAITVPGVGAVDVETYGYGAGVFARYKVAQFGDVKLLLKGSVAADFTTYHSDDADKTETATMLNAAVIPMITYDLTESFTLYADLNFLGVYAGYNFKNKDLGIDRSWEFGAVADSDNVANTGSFKIGFNYNF